ncbi:MAG: hypothetical protein R3194_01950 [Limnobacter sp.]|nr:hypothetical protein [Limnobacter sp.]
MAKTLLLNNPDIKTVTFRGCYLSRVARASILHALADGAPNLERIDLTLPRFALRTELAKNELAGLQAMFEQCPKLQTVKLEHQTSKMQGRINQLAQTVNTNASVEFNLFWPKPAVASRRAQNVQAQEPPALSPEQIAIEIDLDPLTCLTELQAERFATGPKQI